MSKDGIHVAMLPWLAFGHLNPFSQLSIALAKEGVHVSFLSTPRNIKRLPKLSPNNLATLISLVEFPLPALDDKSLLQEDAEATLDISSNKTDYLVAYDLLKKPIKHFIERGKPDWIVADFSPHWVVELSRNLDIPIILFSVLNAAARAFWGSVILGLREVKNGSKPLHEILTSPPYVDFQSTVAYKKYEAIELLAATVNDASGVTSVERRCIIRDACTAVAIRACTEFEGDY